MCHWLTFLCCPAGLLHAPPCCQAAAGAQQQQKMVHTRPTGPLFQHCKFRARCFTSTTCPPEADLQASPPAGELSYSVHTSCCS